MADVLVIDGGGRGNAIAHAFSKSDRVDDVYVTPGNAGVFEYGGNRIPLEEEGKEDRIEEIIQKAEEKGIDPFDNTFQGKVLRWMRCVWHFSSVP